MRGARRRGARAFLRPRSKTDCAWPSSFCTPSRRRHSLRRVGERWHDPVAPRVVGSWRPKRSPSYRRSESASGQGLNDQERHESEPQPNRRERNRSHPLTNSSQPPEKPEDAIGGRIHEGQIESKHRSVAQMPMSGAQRNPRLAGQNATLRSSRTRSPVERPIGNTRSIDSISTQTKSPAHAHHPATVNCRRVRSGMSAPTLEPIRLIAARTPVAATPRPSGTSQRAS